jgi:hypothetical protein
MKTIKTVFAGLLCSLLFAFTGNAQGLETWADNHPDASKALGVWVKAHPDAAHYIFEWDGNHPERSQAMVTWAITHPGENLAKFYNQHKDWPEMELIMTTHKEGTEEFLKWCRDYHEAARTLMLHSGGLKWAGDHLYKAEQNISK